MDYGRSDVLGVCCVQADCGDPRITLQLNAEEKGTHGRVDSSGDSECTLKDVRSKQQGAVRPQTLLSTS